MKGKIIWIFLIFLVGALLISGVFAEAASSTDSSTTTTTTTTTTTDSQKFGSSEETKFTTDKSTGVVNTQFNSPRTEYGSYLHYGGGFYDTYGQKEEVYDLMVTIPPLSCQPYVVRSDLLEEQNVPVFCELSALKINPSLSVARIDGVRFSDLTGNEYISGVGFHPAREAIVSSGSSTSYPLSNKLGYVVVVLKKHETEKTMPDRVTANLSIVMQYDSKNSFGIGRTEFYLPEMSDSDFSNLKSQYSFWNGQGYIRAESVGDGTAVIALYDENLRKTGSVSLKEGEVSRNLMIGSSTGGNFVTVSLEKITLPKTSAKISVNNQEEIAEAGDKIFNSACQIISINSNGGGTGVVKLNCRGKTFELEKKFAEVEVDGKQVKVGEEIKDALKGKKVYLVYLGFDKEKYAVVAESDKELDEGKIKELINIAKDEFVKEKTTFFMTAKPGIVLVRATEQQKKYSFNFPEIVNNDLGEEREYYDKAVKAYNDVENGYADIEYPSRDYATYGSESICRRHTLADKLNQNQDKQSLLSIFTKEYNDNKCTSANLVVENNGVYDDSKAIYVGESDGLTVELISIDEPKVEDSSVKFVYTNGIGDDKSSLDVTAKPGENFVKANGVTFALKYLDSKKAIVSYVCDYETSVKNADGKSSETKIMEKKGEVTFTKPGQVENLIFCNSKLEVKEMNYHEAAKVRLEPGMKDQKGIGNFTFTIGIEKRTDLFELSPKKALDRAKDLNETIAQWEEMNAKIAEAIRVMKISCLVASNGLRLKNMLSGIGGSTTARKIVMTEFWNSKCEKFEESGFSSASQCLLKKNSEINKDVQCMTKLLKEQNKEISKMQEDNKQVNDKSFFGLSGTVNTIASKRSYYDGLVEDNAWLKGVEADDLSYEELKAIDRCLKMKKSDCEFSETAKSACAETLAGKQKTYAKSAELKEKFAGSIKNIGVSSDKIRILENGREVPYMGLDVSDLNEGSILDLKATCKLLESADNPVSIVAVKKDEKIILYLYVLEPLAESSKKDYYSSKGNCKFKFDGNKWVADDTALNLKFSVYTKGSYNNLCTNCESYGAEFYSTGKSKGLPALIPFDKKQGWYVGSVSYSDAGDATVYSICNVDSDGKIDGVNSLKDICRTYDINTEEVLDFPGLDAKESANLVTKAKSALREAARQMQNNPSQIKINGMSLTVRNIDSRAGSKCTDFMSPRDCQIMFNFCDPVVCPSSRCDLGGTYPVDNVIQSGIVGSIVLCLPNIKEGIFIPICLTGIHAGIEGWISILKAYRDCLLENAESGKMMGICDEVHGIYACDFFWRQVGPYVDTLLENLLTFTMGEGLHGGGEYKFVQSSFNNAEQAGKYFASSYAESSKLSFAVGDVNALGAEVCKMQTGVSYPDSLGEVLEPESPPQINAWFDEHTYTTATSPPTSQYKVFYHIYAGNETGSYFMVYLKDPASIGAIKVNPSITIASGYLNRGESATETKDFLETSGYKQLCVRVNSKDYCGFKTVSTSFAVDYVNDKYLEGQAAEQITTEKECVSGTRSIYSTINPNVQQGIEETINPELYNRGIIRVCSTQDPGAGVNEKKWEQVGTCGQENVKCWVDTDSVKNAIKGQGIEGKTLKEIEENAEELMIKEGYFGITEADEEITTLRDAYKNNLKGEKPQDFKKFSADLDKAVDKLVKKMVYMQSKAKLYFLRAEIYDGVAGGDGVAGVESAGEDEKAEEPAKEGERVICGVERRKLIGDSPLCDLSFSTTIVPAVLKDGDKPVARIERGQTEFIPIDEDGNPLPPELDDCDVAVDSKTNKIEEVSCPAENIPEGTDEKKFSWSWDTPPVPVDAPPVVDVESWKPGKIVNVDGKRRIAYDEDEYYLIVKKDNNFLLSRGDKITGSTGLSEQFLDIFYDTDKKFFYATYHLLINNNRDLVKEQFLIADFKNEDDVISFKNEVNENDANYNFDGDILNVHLLLKIKEDLEGKNINLLL